MSINPEELKCLAEKSVLLVDDEEVVTDTVSEIISKWVRSVETASSAGSALELIKRSDYNFLLLDMKMPDMSGKELFEQVKDIKPELASRTVFMTGDTESADVRRFFAANKLKSLSKPFSVIDLLKLLAKMTEAVA